MTRRKYRKGRTYRRFQLTVRLMLLGIFVVWMIMMAIKLTTPGKEPVGSVPSSDEGIDWTGAPGITVDLLTPNEYSRPQLSLEQVNGIVIHYTANPGSSAKANRDYFESLSDGHGTKASSHFIIGIDGEVEQCIPTSEWAYASNDRNRDTISIECCHPDETGAFTDATYQTMVKLTGWLMHRFGLSREEVIRHYDITGKACPLYYVEHEEEWEQFRNDCQDYCNSLSS